MNATAHVSISRHGRRENDRLGARILGAVVAEVRRQRPPEWRELGFEIRVRARVGEAGQIVITEPKVRSEWTR